MGDTKPKPGDLIRVHDVNLVQDMMEEHGPLWVVSSARPSGSVNARSLVTGHEYIWFTHEFITGEEQDNDAR